MSPNTTNTTNPPDTKYLAQPKTESSRKITKSNSSNHIEMYHFDQKRKTKRLSVGDERLLYYKNKNRNRKIYNNNKRKIKVTISKSKKTYPVFSF